MTSRRTILVATDLCDKCIPAAEYALKKAKNEDSAVHFVHGAYTRGNPDNLPPQADASDEELHSRMHTWLKSVGLDPDQINFSVVRSSTPAVAILKAAEFTDSKAIVTGKSRDSWSGLIYGDRVAKSLMSRTPMPITVVS
jgi:nucleotide-binding universal stress UspA family protein